MEKKAICLLLLVFLATSALAPEGDSSNHMNGPGNVVISGVGNSANGQDNTFDGSCNHA